jgi:hypothetical protein
MPTNSVRKTAYKEQPSTHSMDLTDKHKMAANTWSKKSYKKSINVQEVWYQKILEITSLNI